MHKVLVPNQSGVHRFACKDCALSKIQISAKYSEKNAGLALYRALLRQCSPSTVADARQQDESKILIKHRFRKYKNLQSPSQVSNALRAGYEVSSTFFSDVHVVQRF